MARARDQPRRPHGHHAQPEGDADEADDARDLRGPQPGRGIDPPAHRAAGEGADAHRVAQREACEGGQRRHAQRHRRAGRAIAQCRAVIAHHAGIADRRGEEGGRQHARPCARQRLHHGIVVQLGRKASHREDDQNRQGQEDCAEQPVPGPGQPPPPGGAGRGRSQGGRRRIRHHGRLVVRNLSPGQAPGQGPRGTAAAGARRRIPPGGIACRRGLRLPTGLIRHGTIIPGLAPVFPVLRQIPDSRLASHRTPGPARPAGGRAEFSSPRIMDFARHGPSAYGAPVSFRQPCSVARAGPPPSPGTDPASLARLHGPRPFPSQGRLPHSGQRHTKVFRPHDNTGCPVRAEPAVRSGADRSRKGSGCPARQVLLTLAS